MDVSKQVRRPRKRNPVEVLIEILTESKQPIKQTKLISACGIGWKPMVRDVEFLVNEGYLEKTPVSNRSRSGRPVDKKTKFFVKTTAKGLAATRILSDPIVTPLLSSEYRAKYRARQNPKGSDNHE